MQKHVTKLRSRLRHRCRSSRAFSLSISMYSPVMIRETYFTTLTGSRNVSVSKKKNPFWAPAMSPLKRSSTAITLDIVSNMCCPVAGELATVGFVVLISVLIRSYGKYFARFWKRFISIVVRGFKKVQKWGTPIVSRSLLSLGDRVDLMLAYWRSLELKPKKKRSEHAV